MIRLETRKKGWLGISPSQPINRYINPPALVAVVMLMMLVSSITPVVVRPPTVVRRSVRWITTVVVVVATRVIPISRISITVTICRITDAYADSSYPD
jgi:hypothetical protein